ncbi:hypothetical protein CGQ24_07375 [Arthrobacter sp. 7749]|nr:hypothetical protein CGQ24_07375 [Arthrobacter sp. 7749]
MSTVLTFPTSGKRPRGYCIIATIDSSATSNRNYLGEREMSEPAAHNEAAEKPLGLVQDPAETIRPAAASLEGVLELLRRDPSYADALGISEAGVGYLAGAQTVLRSSTNSHNL